MPVSAEGQVALTGASAFRAVVKTTPDAPADIDRLALEAGLGFQASGKLAVAANVAGTLNPVAVKLDGSAAATDLALGGVRVGTLDFDWTLDPEAFAARNLRAGGYKGELSGELRVPLKAGRAGEFRVALTDVDATALTRDLPALPVKLDGRLSGVIRGGVPGTAKDAPPVRVELTSPALRVQGIPAKKLLGEATYKPGEIAYKLTGESLGGSFDLEGTYPLGRDEKPADVVPAGGVEKPAPVEMMQMGPPAPPGGGTFRLRGARLSRLGRELGLDAVRPLRGVVSVDLTYRVDRPGGAPVGSGRVEVVDFGWKGADGLQRADLSSAVRLTGDALELSEITGSFAGGDLRARLRLAFNNPDRSYFTVNLERASARELLGAAGLTASEAVVGLALRGRIGREVRGTGTLTVARGDVAGVRVGEARLPFEWQVTPEGGRVAAREIATTLAGGRLTGSASYAWGAESTVEGNLRFADVSVRSLTGGAGGVTPGRATGSFTFGGRNVRSLNDVQGLLTARLGGEESLFDLPVLRAIAPLLSPTRLLAPTTDGDVRARLGGGVLRVERFTLTGRLVGLFATGTVVVGSGRLDLDVVARTGPVGPNLGPAGRLVRLSATAALPIGAILELSQYLSNRTVRLHVTGSAANPTVTVNAGQILAEEVIRYFLGASVIGGAAAGASTGN